MFDEVREALSRERLASYLRESEGSLHQALELYRWNQDVAGALLRPLCDLEVTLRNSLQRELAVINHPEPWWTTSALCSDAKISTDLERAKTALSREGKPVSAGGMVAQVSFGFWIALVSNRFDMTLWRRGLHRAFPHYRGPRRPLHRDLQRLLGLRNRIGHHEPIHHRHLAADRRTVHRLLGYLSPAMQLWGQQEDRFSQLVSCRPDVRRIPRSRRPGANVR